MTAYDSVLAPPSSQGASSRAPTGIRATAVATRHARPGGRCAGRGRSSLSVAKTVGVTVTVLGAARAHQAQRSLGRRSASRPASARRAPPARRGVAAGSPGSPPSWPSGPGARRAARLAVPDVHRLEDAVAAERAEVVGAQDGVSAGTTPSPRRATTRVLLHTPQPIRRRHRIRFVARFSGVGRGAALPRAAADRASGSWCWRRSTSWARHARPGARRGRARRRPGSTSPPSTGRSSCSRSSAWSRTPTSRTARRPTTRSASTARPPGVPELRRWSRSCRPSRCTALADTLQRH